MMCLRVRKAAARGSQFCTACVQNGRLGLLACMHYLTADHPSRCICNFRHPNDQAERLATVGFAQEHKAHHLPLYAWLLLVQGLRIATCPGHRLLELPKHGGVQRAPASIWMRGLQRRLRPPCACQPRCWRWRTEVCPSHTAPPDPNPHTMSLLTKQIVSSSAVFHCRYSRLVLVLQALAVLYSIR